MSELVELADEQDGVLLEPWKCPRVADVLDALRESPSRATEAQKDAMHLLLNVALPSVDARLNKQWKRGMTHMAFFANTYPFEFAIAFLLIDHFSDTNNILYNAGFADEEGNIKEKAEVKAPAHKKRRKMQTSKNSLELQKAYYVYVKQIKEEMKTPGFKEIMAGWDASIADTHRFPEGGDDAAATTTAENRINTVPLIVLKERDEACCEHREANEFFESLFPTFTLTYGGSVSSDSSAGSPGVMPPLGTQGSPQSTTASTARI